MRVKEGDRVATVITGQAEKKAVKTSSLVTGKQRLGPSTDWSSPWQAG